MGDVSKTYMEMAKRLSLRQCRCHVGIINDAAGPLGLHIGATWKHLMIGHEFIGVIFMAQNFQSRG